jgi:hypothetical protein
MVPASNSEMNGKSRISWVKAPFVLVQQKGSSWSTQSTPCEVKEIIFSLLKKNDPG